MMACRKSAVHRSAVRSNASSKNYFSTKPGSIENNPTLVVEVSNVKLISI
jgi:hypothetical protein